MPKVYENKFFKITEESYKKKNGEMVKEYYTVHRPDAVIIAAFTQDKDIILIRQYRNAVKSESIEIPAGFMEPKEKPLQAAKRELMEETGFKAKKLIKIGETFANASMLSNHVHFFIAFDCEKAGPQHLDQNEEIEVKITSWKKALTLLKKSDIMDIGSSLGIMLAKEYLNENNIKL